MEFIIKAYNIDYSVTEEDVCPEIDNDPTIVEDSEEYYDAIHKRIAEIKSSLPSRMIFTIECDDIYDLEDLVCNYITEKSGWLVNAFQFKYKKVAEELKDYFGHIVKPGDKVVLLYKAYGFNGIDRAYLITVIYKGKGRWGHEFDWRGRLNRIPLIRMREPQCIKISKKGGK